MNRNQSIVASAATREHVALNDWQIEETRKGVAEAERSEFASDRDIERTLRKWIRRCG